MSSTSLISFVLWIPFALIVLISGLIFCISGYRKGLWRALLALGATILAALISLLLARLIAGLLSPSVIGRVPSSIFEHIALPINLLMDLLRGAVKVVIALVLFPLFMFIFTIVFRLLGDHLLKEKLASSAAGMKWGGMAVGLVCAVCYTLMMLLPLYGTCSTYIPTVNTLLSLQASEEEEPAQISVVLDAISEHPVVKMSGSAPVAAMYSGLAALDVGDASLDIPKMVSSVNRMLDAVQAAIEADPEDAPERYKELIHILRQECVDTDWFYSMAQTGIDTIRDSLPLLTDSVNITYINSLLDVLDCPKEDFDANFAAILDFLSFALEQDVITMVENNDLHGLYTNGIILEAGKLANFSDEAIAIKELIYTATISTILDNDLDAAAAFLEQYDLTVSETDAIEQEAESILMIFSGLSEAAAIMRHPCLGEPAVLELIELTDFATVMGLTDPYQSAAAEQINSDPALQEELMEKLRYFSTLPLGSEESFYDVLNELTDMYPSEEYAFSYDEYAFEYGENEQITSVIITP